MPYIFKQYFSPRQVFFIFGEALLIFLSINVVYFLFSGYLSFAESWLLLVSRSAIVTVIILLCLNFLDLYDLVQIRSFADEITRAVQAIGISCIILALIYYAFPFTIIPTHIFWPSLLAISLSVGIWRSLYNYVLHKKIFSQPIIIVGTGKMAAEIATELTSRRDSGFQIVHFIGSPEHAHLLPGNIPISAEHDLLPELCQKHRVERIVVAIDDRRGHTPIQQLMECKFLGYPVEYGVNFYEKLCGKILVERVNPDWIIFSNDFAKSKLILITKGLPEVVLALLGLIAISPIIAISALIIKLESPGPVFYQQQRVGLRGKPFNLIKLRSMRSDAEKDGPVWAKQDDDRVTKFGRFIRRTRIDELPQLFNVIRGDMSLVGPRPERPIFVEQLQRSIPYYALRHNVKPGISGWAQICYPYGASETDALRKLEYDLFYVKYMSIQIDIWVIFQTIKTMLFLKGSR